MPTAAMSITSHLSALDARLSLLRDVETGLTSSPKELSPRWLYDDRGCELYGQITRLDEYYPFRAESEILAAVADEVARATGADTLVELGSGSAEKTRTLLTALDRAGTLRRFTPFDVAEAALARTVVDVSREMPTIDIEGVVGDLENHVAQVRPGDRTLVALLGGTVGNLRPEPRAKLLSDVASVIGADGYFLLGTDLLKDRHRLVRAYDDSSGVTAAFNLNVLAMLNREVGADFDLERFDHQVLFDEQNQWIEMRLRCRRAQIVHIADLDMTVDIAEDEFIRTEISAKFTRDRVVSELGAHGLELEHWWTDDSGDFALSLSRAR